MRRRKSTGEPIIRKRTIFVKGVGFLDGYDVTQKSDVHASVRVNGKLYKQNAQGTWTLDSVYEVPASLDESMLMQTFERDGVLYQVRKIDGVIRELPVGRVKQGAPSLSRTVRHGFTEVKGR